MTTAAEYQSKVEKSVTNFARLDAIVNGGPSVVVTTDNGDVPSFAKVIADTGYTGTSAADAIASAASANTDKITVQGIREEIVGIAASLFRSGTIADRGPSPSQNYENGFHYYCNDISPPRLFCWVTTGNADPNGVIATEDHWFSYYTPAEIKNLGIDFTGTLPAANVENLPALISATDDLVSIAIADFRAVARDTDTNPTVDLIWAIKGVQPDSQTVSWGASSVALSGAMRSFTPKDWSAVKQLFVVGNSLSDSTDSTDRWSQVLATSRGVALYSVARYSSDARQVYRSGAEPIYLTLSSNQLPAGGTSGSITLINGVAPSNNPDLFEYGGNPASFLNTGDASLTTGCSMTGTIVSGTQTRHVTVSISNAASTAYSIVGDAGEGSLTTSGPVLFVPDIARQMASSDLIIWMGNNYFYSGVANTYGDYTNPQFWVDLAKIVARAEGNRVLILPIIPDSSWATTGTGNPYTAMQAANARTEALYPAYVARDTAGRTLLQRLQASGDGSANDNADIAAGLVPRSLHRSGDTLHLNSAGDAIVAAFVAEAMAQQTLPETITQNTVFALHAVGTNPRTSATIDDLATATVQTGALASLSDQVAGATANSAYRPTLAEAVVDLAVGTYFSSRDMDGVGPHAGVRWNYKRIATSPYWEAVDVWVDKSDVGLGSYPDNPYDLPIRGGPMANGVWIKLPAVYALALGGAGTVTLDTQTRDGTVSAAVKTYSPTGTDLVKYPYFGANAAYVRATLTGTATAEIF